MAAPRPLFVSHNLSAIRTFCKRGIAAGQGKTGVRRSRARGPGAVFARRAEKSGCPQRGVEQSHGADKRGGTVYPGVGPQSGTGETVWNFRPGEMITLLFEYEVVERIQDLAFPDPIELRGGRADDHHHPQGGFRNAPFRRRDRADRAYLARNPVASGEITIYACLSRIDDVVYYDVVDANVDLPLLTINSDSEQI